MALARVPVYMPISRDRDVAERPLVRLDLPPLCKPRCTVCVSRARQHVQIRRAASLRVSQRSRGPPGGSQLRLHVGIDEKLPIVVADCAGMRCGRQQHCRLPGMLLNIGFQPFGPVGRIRFDKEVSKAL